MLRKLWHSKIIFILIILGLLAIALWLGQFGMVLDKYGFPIHAPELGK